VINKEILQTTMHDIQLAVDTFVSDNFIYFVHRAKGEVRAHIDQYNLLDNSHTRSIITENVTKMKVFNNEYFYWRTQLGGLNETKH
jgi:hypothetical protein